ncbi:ArsR/SmtB family transcription factor [Marivita hallyeonensis]|uniref:Transcriptional regulator, ArsR family n=1 Tax=Marivita hallyeonensis TaxID=996342 RepID=A0A1M5W872_9RHOB|nr:metalloregulator ArsR/SmtB family transcription factor [Marivita hallyeonensis]SHH83384.1 transcriptional regulator, ArsR family [Marivita hallyeonensis]
MPFDIPQDATFTALADPTRRAILARLAEGQATVAELADPFQISQPAISRHLRVLEKAGLISTRIDAQRRPRQLNPQALAQVATWLTHLAARYEAQYQRLDAVLEDLQSDPTIPEGDMK